MNSVKSQICFIFVLCFSGEAARYVSGGNKADPTKSVTDHSAGKLNESNSALDTGVPAQREELDKVVDEKAHSEEEMLVYIQKEDDRGRVAEASVPKNITDSQMGFHHSAGNKSALDAEVAAQQEKLDKLVDRKLHFEAEMLAKAEYNRKKDEQGRVAEASALKNITDSQKGRLEVEREIASFAKELAKQDAVRQQKIDALHDIMDVLTVRVDGQERLVVAKELEAAALQTVVDAVENERSLIVDAMSATSKSEQDAARHEAADVMGWGGEGQLP